MRLCDFSWTCTQFVRKKSESVCALVAGELETQGAVPNQKDSWVLTFRPTGRVSGKLLACPQFSEVMVRKAEWPLKWRGRGPAPGGAPASGMAGVWEQPLGAL